ncbi:MAG: TolC family protein, partial [Elusimicrobia bacterium]|nr:TolC family protein [Elusimicrobiota bacterium]
MTLLAALLLAAAPALAQPPRLAVTLADAETRALAHSPVLKAADSELQAALDQFGVQLSALVPRLTLDGSVGYQTHVAEARFSPLSPPVPFGDHKSYSIGPALGWTLFDGGGLLSAWRGQRALAGSAEAQRDLARRQVRLMARLDYFQVQLALEQERSLVDSLRLAEAQYRDISARYRAGSASRIDWLSAHQEVLNRRRDLRGSQAALAGSLRALFALTGQGQDLDVSAALDSRVEEPLPPGVSTPTVVVALEPLEAVEARLEAAAGRPADPDYPGLLVYSRQEQARRLGARSLAAGRWPRVGLSFRSDYFYPDMPVLAGAWQNAVGVTASVPLFELGRSRKEAAGQR